VSRKKIGFFWDKISQLWLDFLTNTISTNRLHIIGGFIKQFVHSEIMFLIKTIFTNLYIKRVSQNIQRNEKKFLYLIQRIFLGNGFEDFFSPDFKLPSVSFHFLMLKIFHLAQKINFIA
jgi:hypothetical protein